MCPASIQACENYENVSSAAADEGTDAHHCLETFMIAWLAGWKNGSEEAIAKLLRKTYPRAMVKHAREAFHYIVGRAKGADNVLAETTVDASFFTMKGQFGTVDAGAAFLFDKLVVIDFKYGIGVPVMPEENTQAIYYALGIAKEFDFNFAEVELVIVQPRDGHSRGPIRSWTIPIQKLLSYIPVFKEGVARCEDPLAEFNAGEEWCMFCPAKPGCVAYSELRHEQAQGDFTEVE
jgi:hypothetical protein